MAERLLPGEVVLTDTDVDVGTRVVASVTVLDTLSIAVQYCEAGRWVPADRVVLGRQEMQALGRLLKSIGYVDS